MAHAVLTGPITGAARGMADRVKQVDAEIARLTGQPPKRRTARKTTTAEG